MFKRAGSICILFFSSLASAATDYVAEVSYPAEGSRAIPQFSFRQTRLPVTVKSRAGKSPQLIVDLQGAFERKGWHLIWDNQSTKGPIRGEKEFVRRVELKKEETVIEVVAVGPLGETERTKVKVAFSAFEELIHGRRKKAYQVTPGLGMTLLSYEQTAEDDFSQTALTGKISYLYAFEKTPWSLAGNIYFTALPLSTNQDVNARYIGVNLRAGYEILVRSAVRVTVLFGGYYATMAVTEKRFGYSNLMGPQIYPAVTYTLNPRNKISGYLKFSPISDGLTVLSLSNNEMAGGASWTRTLKNGHPVSATLDIAKLQVSKKAIEVKSTSMTLGVSYGL